MNDNTSLATRKTVEELVREWNMASHLLQTGLETLKQAEEHFRAFDGPGSHYPLIWRPRHPDWYSPPLNNPVKRVRYHVPSGS